MIDDERLMEEQDRMQREMLATNLPKLLDEVRRGEPLDGIGMMLLLYGVTVSPTTDTVEMLLIDRCSKEADANPHWLDHLMQRLRFLGKERVDVRRFVEDHLDEMMGQL